MAMASKGLTFQKQQFGLERLGSLYFRSIALPSQPPPPLLPLAAAAATALSTDALAALFLRFTFLPYLPRPAQVGSGASLWYGSVVRGDVNHVVIGAGSSVGDSAVLHVAGLAGNKPTIVGSNVVIGACVSCTSGVGCLLRRGYG